jgi:hypothetical protein
LKTIGDSYVFAGGLFSGSNQLEESLEACLKWLIILEKEKNLANEWTMRWYSYRVQ